MQYRINLHSRGIRRSVKKINGMKKQSSRDNADGWPCVSFLIARWLGKSTVQIVTINARWWTLIADIEIFHVLRGLILFFFFIKVIITINIMTMNIYETLKLRKWLMEFWSMDERLMDTCCFYKFVFLHTIFDFRDIV